MQVFDLLVQSHCEESGGGPIEFPVKLWLIPSNFFQLANPNIVCTIVVLNCFTYVIYEQISFFVCDERFTNCRGWSEVRIFPQFSKTAFLKSSISGLFAYYVIHNSSHKNGYYEFRHFLFCRWVGVNLQFSALLITQNPHETGFIWHHHFFKNSRNEKRPNKIRREKERVIMVAKSTFSIIVGNINKKNGLLDKMTRERNRKTFDRENLIASLDLNSFLMQFSMWILVDGNKRKFGIFPLSTYTGIYLAVLVISFTRKNSYANWEQVAKAQKCKNLL